MQSLSKTDRLQRKTEDKNINKPSDKFSKKAQVACKYQSLSPLHFLKRYTVPLEQK